MSFIKFLTSKTFLINIAIAIGILIILIIIFFQTLKSITHHGEYLTVPDMTGKTIEEVQRITEERNLRFVISDSVYFPELSIGSVVSHNPEPFSQVKRNRTIYITINSDTPPMVPVPHIIDESLRQAIRHLESRNLRVGELIYKPDIGLNVVLAMEYGGREIQPGDSVYKGSEIDIILGDGLASTRVQVPDLRTFSLTEARFILHEYGLNLGAVNYHVDTEDSTRAIIYDQVPLPREGADIAHGEAISIFLAEPEIIDSHNLNQSSNTEDFNHDENNGLPNDEF